MSPQVTLTVTLPFVQEALDYHGEISAGCCCVPSGRFSGVLLRAVTLRHLTSRNANGDVAICAGGAALPRGDQRGVLLCAVRTVQRQVLHQLPRIRAGHGPDAVLPDRELHPVLLLGRDQTEAGETPPPEL